MVDVPDGANVDVRLLWPELPVGGLDEEQTAEATAEALLTDGAGVAAEANYRERQRRGEKVGGGGRYRRGFWGYGLGMRGGMRMRKKGEEPF